MSDLLQALTHSDAVEQIAETLWDATKGDSVLFWDELPQVTRGWYRAKGRQALRSCLPYAVTVATEGAARTLAMTDGHKLHEISDESRARYRDKAQQVVTQFQWYLAEAAYPEAEERAMASAATPIRGQTLGERVVEIRRRM